MFGDGWGTITGPKAVALGGTQTITVYRSAAGSAFDQPIEADSSGPALSIASTLPPQVVVRGDAEGTAKLRIVEPETSSLYDRIELRVVPLSAIDVLPTPLIEVVWYDPALAEPHAPRAYWHGIRQAFVIALLAAGDERIVDDRLTFTLPSELTTDSTQWDRFETAGAALGTYTVTATSSDGVAHTTSVRMVSWVDEIILLADGLLGGGDPSSGVVVGSGASYCFRARNAGAGIIGATWDYFTNSRLEVSSATKNCVHVRGLAPGDGLLTWQ